MREYKTEFKEDQVLTKIFCNKCGKEAYSSKMQVGAGDLVEHFRIQFGYFSNRDLEQVDFDLCLDCIEGLLSSFKIPPDIHDYDVWTGENYGEKL
jgi:hypothetical protein